MTRAAMFELDNDQDGCPEGYEAYILRAPQMRYVGSVVAVKVANGLPHLVYDGDASAIPTNSNTPSRVFVKRGAPIDPAVFGITIDY